MRFHATEFGASFQPFRTRYQGGIVTERISKVFAEYNAALYDAVRAEVMQAIGAAMAQPQPKPQPQTKKPREVQQAKKARRKPTKAKKARRKPKPQPRTERLARDLAEAIADLVRRAPGTRPEGIAKALGVKRELLKRPVKQLLQDGVLRAEGKTRAVTYWPASA
jgi:ribosomal protein S25